jgi:hypothetical protein
MWRSPPTSRHRPTTPLQMIITAEKIVSRATAALPSPPVSITDRIRAVSMTVTANARMSVPNGSPTR